MHHLWPEYVIKNLPFKEVSFSIMSLNGIIAKAETRNDDNA